MAAARRRPGSAGRAARRRRRNCAPDALEALEPEEEHFHEATGNEGASFERTYRRAAFVLWPRRRFFAVLNQAGLPVTLPYLSELTERWNTSGEDRRSPFCDQARDLSRHMVSSWPTEAWYPRNSKAPSEAAHMLTLLTAARGHAADRSPAGEDRSPRRVRQKGQRCHYRCPRYLAAERARRRRRASDPADGGGVAQRLR